MSQASRESSLWGWLNKVKSLYRRELHMCRVENSVMEGMADVEGCLRRTQFWIELKCEPRPANPSTRIHIRFEEGQLPWLGRRVDAGGRAFVLVQIGQGHAASRYLVPGRIAHALAGGITEVDLRALAVVDPQVSAREIIEAVVSV